MLLLSLLPAGVAKQAQSSLARSPTWRACHSDGHLPVAVATGPRRSGSLSDSDDTETVGHLDSLDNSSGQSVMRH
jgi:hypothetical protein